MQTRHPLRSALVATCVPLVMIMVFGNAWFTEHVRLDPDHGALARRLLATLGAFPWTFTPRRGDGGGTVWIAQWLGILVVLGGTFLVVWAVARHATGSSLFLGAWGVMVPVAMFGASVTRFLVYDTFFGDTDVDGLGRFWHSVYQGQEVALWGIGVGVPVGLFAAAMVGGVDRSLGYLTSAPIPGSALPEQQDVAEQAAAPPSPWDRLTFVEEPVVTAPPAPAVPIEVPAAPLPRQPMRKPSKVLVEPVPPAEPPQELSPTSSGS